ncbi:MAG: DUF4129 domain-containing protein [Solirubrobacterales bacterium]
MSPHCRALGVAVALAVTLVGAGSAAAQGGDLSAGQVADLADRAAGGDRAALAELQGVTAIDGRPAVIAETLAGASPQLRVRLQELGRSLRAEAPDAGIESAEQARADAERIVAGFGDLEANPAPGAADVDSVPAPPGSGGLGLGGLGLWLPLLALALLAGVVLAVRLARNREAAGRLEREGEPGEGEPASPSDLERAALAAERAGDFASAVRLRFGLAVEELEERGLLSIRPSLTSSEVAVRLADRRASSLVGTFERVVYGRFEASSEDAVEAREGWPAVISARGDR